MLSYECLIRQNQIFEQLYNQANQENNELRSKRLKKDARTTWSSNA